MAKVRVMEVVVQLTVPVHNYYDFERDDFGKDYQPTVYEVRRYLEEAIKVYGLQCHFSDFRANFTSEGIKVSLPKVIGTVK